MGSRAWRDGGRAAAALLTASVLALVAYAAVARAGEADAAPAAPAAERAPAAVEHLPGTGLYAVVVSRATWDDAAWRKAAEALRAKYAAHVVIYGGAVGDVRAALASIFPRYACFVARPEEAGLEFVVAVHRLTRALDDDPYTDLMWGILTGYDAGDALRIASRREPLVVRRALAGTGIDLEAFDEGRWFSEGEQGVLWEKRPGAKPEKKEGPADATAAIVEALNAGAADLLVTSGHATTRDWQIGYSFKSGQLRSRAGRLYGLDLGGKEHPVDSPNPKVYLPAGNCLIGRMAGPDCMAAAFMHSAGVYQMYGYVVPTWHGYGGWGVLDLFVGRPGRYTLAEAFYVNTQALVHELEVRFPRAARVAFDRFDLEADPGLIGKLAAEHGIQDREELGLLWDRDTVAFYGDPAWEARLAPRPLAWRETVTETGGVYTFTVAADRDAEPKRPPMAFLPHRVKDVRILEGADLAPVVTDNFILLGKPAKFERGKSYKVVFKAARQ